ncbi:MAG: CIA30 family protein [Candidatus Goldbacteria bacterium]|nr:CIA30 family protein [Candidatus Goldiibacteriota bacterium]
MLKKPVFIFIAFIFLGITHASAYVLDDFEDGEFTVNNQGGGWYEFADPTTSSVTRTVISGDVPSGGGTYSGRISGNVIGASGSWASIGCGTNLNSGANPVDLNLSTGIRLYMKGNYGTGTNVAFMVQIVSANVTDYSYWNFAWTQQTNWTYVTIPWTSFGSPGWGQGNGMTLTQVLSRVQAIQFSIADTTGGAVNNTGNNWYIDSIEIYGVSTATDTPTNTPYAGTPTNTPTVTPTTEKCRRFLAYYPYWVSTYRADKIPYNRLTHICHAFVQPQSNGSLSAPSGYLEPALITNAHNAGVRVLVSIGGADEVARQNFVTIAASASLRTAFANAVEAFCRTYGYDGADIDWEFPQNATERTNQNLLVQTLRDKFNSSAAPAPSWEITMAVSPGNWYGQWNDYAYLNNVVDFYNLMTYDYHGEWSSHAGHNSPLYRGTDPTDGENIDWTNNYMTVTRGVPASKMNLGIPFYGYRFPNSENLYDSFVSGATQNNYNLITPLIGSGWTYNWDSGSLVPYLTYNSGTGLIVYDNPASVAEKVNYAFNLKGYGGIFMWEITADYSSGSQPLLDAMWNSYSSFCGLTVPTVTPTETKTVLPTITHTSTLIITPTFTRTFTGTMTYSATNTRTNTETASFSPAFTSTSTATNIFTHTLTATVTFTFTPTWTFTITHNTLTTSPTHSVSPTITQTWTGTPPTLTVTTTITLTDTMTASSTLTETTTPGFTRTATSSEPPTASATVSSTSTVTITPANSFTLTGTMTITSSYTQTEWISETPTLTNSLTMTHTMTGTSVLTWTDTMTPEPTFTSTQTMTMTGQTPTPTETAGTCLHFYIDRSSVPSMVFMKKITLKINVGNCSSCMVYADGVPIPSTYYPATQICKFTTDATDVQILRSNYIGGATNAVTKAILFDDKKWAYSFTFDDGRPSVHDIALPMLDALGFRAGVALNTQQMQETYDTYVMCWQKISDLRAHNWSLFDHNYSHQAVTCDNINTETLPVKNAIEARYPGYLCTHFVYPYCNVTSWTCLRDSGLFLSAENYTRNNYVDIIPSNLFLLNRNAFTGTNLSAFNAAADNAANDTRQRWLINFTHNVESGSTTPGTYDTNQDTLSSHLNYVYNTYGEGGINNVWFAPSDEVVQYLLVREYATVTYQGEVACSTGMPTPSFTRTPVIPTVTHTVTPIQTSTSNQQPAITNVVIYPNPYNPEKKDLKIRFEITQPSKLIKVKIYTTGYRMIKQIVYEGNYNAGENTETIKREYLKTLANGVYYIIIDVRRTEGDYLNSRPEELIILK